MLMICNAICRAQEQKPTETDTSKGTPKTPDDGQRKEPASQTASQQADAAKAGEDFFASEELIEVSPSLMDNSGDN